MELKKQLNLNKHPGDALNNSFIAAKNIKLSNDGRMIVNEEGLQDCVVIKEAINNANITNFKIVGVISTSYELILFVIDADNNNRNFIFRYKEGKENIQDSCILVNTLWKYNGGKIKGTYTYNVDGDLIICIAEYDANADVPLKTINLDKDTYIDEKTYIVPEVPYCAIGNINTITGRAYRGYYEFYVRYKIDDNNYTQWYYINAKPLLDEINDKQIMGIGTLEGSYNAIMGHIDFVSEDSDLCNLTLHINYYIGSCNIHYDKLQFGYIVNSKAYTKCYRTNDILFKSDPTTENNYYVDYKNEIEYNIEDLTKSYYNYYNVKNIINYKNRIYISNYKENNYNLKEEDLLNEDNTPYSIKDNMVLSPIIKNNNIIFNRYFDLVYINSTENKYYKVVMSKRTIIQTNFDGNNQFQYCLFSDFIGTNNCIVTIDGTDYNARDVYFKFQAPYMMGVYELCAGTRENIKSKDSVIKYKIKDDYQTYTLKVGHVYALSWYYMPTIQQNEIINNTLLAGEVYDFYIHFVDKFGHATNGIRLENDGRISSFGVYTNSNGDKLFKIGDYNTFYSSGYKYIKLYLAITNFPKGYVAAFISYAKFNKTRKITGLLDFKGTGAMTENGINNPRLNTGYIDDSDKVDLGINKIYSETIINYNYKNSSLIEMNASSNFAGDAKAITASSIPDDDSLHIYNICKGAKLISSDVKKHDIVVADSSENNNIGRESYINIKDSDIPEECKYVDNSRIIISLANENNYKYIEDQKELIPTSCVYMKTTNGNICYDNSTGYNGFIAIDTFINYNYKGFLLNTTTGAITTISNNAIFNKDMSTLKKDKPYTAYSIMYPFDYPLHYKVINNAPTIQFYTYDNDKIGVEYIVEPKNTVDLYKYKHQLKSDIGCNKLFVNYNKNNINKTIYNQTIRRSNIIQDESRINAWRQFPIEGYKNITENKGNITNLVGIGYYLLAHTEHSLFMFDTNASLKTQDKDVQLYQPDAFEVDYKEVFTSDKGFGGLQDDLSYIVGDFGYIYYNNDFHTLYQFNDGNLKIMSSDIEIWLDKYLPYNVRFANDKYNYRLLIKMDYTFENTSPLLKNTINKYHNEVISYNYKTGTFVSLHDYYFNIAWQTKTKCYFQTVHNNDRLNCPLHIFTNEYNYGRFHTHMSDDSNSLYYISKQLLDNNELIYNSYVDIIINESYDLIKFLEYIKYKVRKIYIPIYTENINNSVDIRKHPYAGDILRIFNEDNDSGDIDITVEKLNQFNKFKKPWYEDTQWNFNYFRNNINNHTNKSSDKLRRLYGNYIIIRFLFNNADNLRIEFESLDCKFSIFRKE